MLIESGGRWKFYLGLNVTGTVYGTAFSSTSDSRLKTNIEEIPEQDAINLLKTVSAKTYNRIDMKSSSKRHCGFIAQDFINIPKSLGENFVEPLLTEINDEGPDIELHTLAYDRVGSPILWTVCKNIFARIEALESQLNSD